VKAKIQKIRGGKLPESLQVYLNGRKETSPHSKFRAFVRREGIFGTNDTLLKKQKG